MSLKRDDKIDYANLRHIDSNTHIVNYTPDTHAQWEKEVVDYVGSMNYVNILYGTFKLQPLKTTEETLESKYSKEYLAAEAQSDADSCSQSDEHDDGNQKDEHRSSPPGSPDPLSSSITNGDDEDEDEFGFGPSLPATSPGANQRPTSQGGPDASVNVRGFSKMSMQTPSIMSKTKKLTFRSAEKKARKRDKRSFSSSGLLGSDGSSSDSDGAVTTEDYSRRRLEVRVSNLRKFAIGLQMRRKDGKMGKMRFITEAPMDAFKRSLIWAKLVRSLIKAPNLIDTIYKGDVQSLWFAVCRVKEENTTSTLMTKMELANEFYKTHDVGFESWCRALNEIWEAQALLGHKWSKAAKLAKLLLLLKHDKRYDRSCAFIKENELTLKKALSRLSSHSREIGDTLPYDRKRHERSRSKVVFNHQVSAFKPLIDERSREKSNGSKVSQCKTYAQHGYCDRRFEKQNPCPHAHYNDVSKGGPKRNKRGGSSSNYRGRGRGRGRGNGRGRNARPPLDQGAAARAGTTPKRANVNSGQKHDSTPECFQWQEGGSCTNGDACLYKHGENDTRHGIHAMSHDDLDKGITSSEEKSAHNAASSTRNERVSATMAPPSRINNSSERVSALNASYSAQCNAQSPCAFADSKETNAFNNGFVASLTSEDGDADYDERLPTEVAQPEITSKTLTIAAIEYGRSTRVLIDTGASACLTNTLELLMGHSIKKCHVQFTGIGPDGIVATHRGLVRIYAARPDDWCDLEFYYSPDAKQTYLSVPQLLRAGDNYEVSFSAKRPQIKKNGHAFCDLRVNGDSEHQMFYLPAEALAKRGKTQRSQHSVSALVSHVHGGGAAGQ